ncbi:hypothetical protein HJ170_22545 [Vibrio parahaemolyticus]|nr:hypothetical protein [Vibrio parahaemolyticus]
MGTLELQNKVKIYLKELDWSYYHLAEAVYEYENDDFGHREEIETLKEKIKKQLSRATTKCSVLTHYINVIEESEKFINLKKKKTGSLQSRCKWGRDGAVFDFSLKEH